jgi:hypothetical protein
LCDFGGPVEVAAAAISSRQNAESLDLREQGVDIVALADVDPIGSRVEPLALQLSDRRFKATRADVDTRDAATLLAEAFGDREADPTR